MTCKDILLYESGELNAAQRQAFEQHLKTCASCQAQLKLMHSIESSLIAPAAPAALVERVLTRTTRKPTWWARWRTTLAGAMAVVLIAAVVGIRMLQPSSFSHSELVAYMSENVADEYATFMQDLDLFERTF